MFWGPGSSQNASIVWVGIVAPFLTAQHLPLEANNPELFKNQAKFWFWWSLPNDFLGADLQHDQ